MKLQFFTKLQIQLVLITLALTSIPAFAQLQPRTSSSLSNQSKQAQPLTLEQAFPFYVSAVSPGQYKVTWNLADGHYLYRHAFDFTFSQNAASQNADAQAVAIDFTVPDGLKKVDQFFGDIEAYYGELTIDLRLGTVPGPDARIFIHYQGCADWGFCYPPQRFEFPLSP